MATQVQWRHGTTVEHTSFTGVEAEVTVDTTKDTLVVHDGFTAGGHPMAKEAALTSGLAGKYGLSTAVFTGDLNTLTTAGEYRIDTTATNKPGSEAGTLYVGVAGARFSQLFIRTTGSPVAGSVQVHVRSYGSTSLAWSPWELLVGQTALDSTIAALNLASGTYTPVQVGTNTNVDSVTHFAATYARCGELVTVSGQIIVDATAATTDTVVRFSLPIASNLAASYQLTGVATQNAGLAIPSVLVGFAADATNDCALMRFTSPSTAAVNYNYHFSYRVI